MQAIVFATKSVREDVHGDRRSHQQRAATSALDRGAEKGHGARGRGIPVRRNRHDAGAQREAHVNARSKRTSSVDEHPLYNTHYVLEQLPNWYEDYNEYHPHEALKMKSPCEYRKYAVKLDECPVK